MNNYYVYRYIRLDTNMPFYVGKGKGKRAKRINNRNTYFKNIIKSIPCELEFVFQDISEEMAFAKEIEFIKLYKEAGYCEANLTSGGDGASGRIASSETKEKISIANRNRILTPEQRKKISEFKKGRKNPNKKKKTLSLEHREKLAKSQTGRKHSAESKAKISIAITLFKNKKPQ